MTQEVEYTFEKMLGGAFQVRLQGEFVCFTHEKSSERVDEILEEIGFSSRQDFLDHTLENYREESLMNQEVENPIIAPINEPMECGNDWHGVKVQPGDEVFHDPANDAIIHVDDLEDYVMEKLGFTVGIAK